MREHDHDLMGHGWRWTEAWTYARDEERVLIARAIETYERVLGARPIGWNSRGWPDRKSTRLNSSHMSISYAVFCLKKKNNNTKILSVARNLGNEGRSLTILSKDRPIRGQASAGGVQAEEARADVAVQSGRTSIGQV